MFFRVLLTCVQGIFLYQGKYFAIIHFSFFLSSFKPFDVVEFAIAVSECTKFLILSLPPWQIIGFCFSLMLASFICIDICLDSIPMDLVKQLQNANSRPSVGEGLVSRPLSTGFDWAQPKRKRWVSPPIGPPPTGGAIGVQCYMDRVAVKCRCLGDPTPGCWSWLLDHGFSGGVGTCAWASWEILAR